MSRRILDIVSHRLKLALTIFVVGATVITIVVNQLSQPQTTADNLDPETLFSTQDTAPVACDLPTDENVTGDWPIPFVEDDRSFLERIIDNFMEWLRSLFGVPTALKNFAESAHAQASECIELKVADIKTINHNVPGFNYDGELYLILKKDTKKIDRLKAIFTMTGRNPEVYVRTIEEVNAGKLIRTMKILGIKFVLDGRNVSSDSASTIDVIYTRGNDRKVIHFDIVPRDVVKDARGNVVKIGTWDLWGFKQHAVREHDWSVIGPTEIVKKIIIDMKMPNVKKIYGE